MTAERLFLVGSIVAASIMTCSPAVGQQNNASPADQDNTRAYGTVLDSSGSPLANVDIWISNNDAPANRVRSRNRKTGVFLLRNIGRLYTEDDYGGITLRLLFERDGYRSVQTTLGVQRDGIEILYPVLFTESEEVELPGINALLMGRVVNAKGKSVKVPTIEVRTLEGTEIAKVTGEKNGDYEVLLWNAPQRVRVIVESTLGEKELEVDLTASSSAQVIFPQRLAIRFD